MKHFQLLQRDRTKTIKSSSCGSLGDGAEVNLDQNVLERLWKSDSRPYCQSSLVSFCPKIILKEVVEVFPGEKLSIVSKRWCGVIPSTVNTGLYGDRTGKNRKQ